MDVSSTVPAIISGVGAIVTVAGGTYTAIRTGRDKEDRRVDRTVAEATADKIDEEKEQIAQQTRSLLLKDLREDLRSAREEAEAYRKEAEKYRREAYDLRDMLADEKRKSAQVIERLTRRAEVLEDWIKDNKTKFDALGINGLPEDVREDRRQEGDE